VSSRIDIHIRAYDQATGTLHSVGREAGSLLRRLNRLLRYRIGTGIVTWNYTFETVEVENSVLLVEGYGACISIIGVDVR